MATSTISRLDLKGKRLFLTAEDTKTEDVFRSRGEAPQHITGSASLTRHSFFPESNKRLLA